MSPQIEVHVFAHKSSTVAFPALDETRASGGGVVVVAGMGLTLLGAGRQEVVGRPVKSEAAPPPSEDAVRTLLPPPLTPPAARRATVPQGAWLRASDPGSYPLFASATPRKKRLGRREMRCKFFFVRRRGVRECPASIGSPPFPSSACPSLVDDVGWRGSKRGLCGCCLSPLLAFCARRGEKKNHTAYKHVLGGMHGLRGAVARSVGRRQVSVIFKSILLAGWFSGLAERASVRCPYPSQAQGGQEPICNGASRPHFDRPEDSRGRSRDERRLSRFARVCGRPSPR